MLMKEKWEIRRKKKLLKVMMHEPKTARLKEKTKKLNEKIM
jgi:hypothetical protein